MSAKILRLVPDPPPPRPRYLRLDQGGDGEPGLFVDVTLYHFARRTLWLMRWCFGWRIVDRLP